MFDCGSARVFPAPGTGQSSRLALAFAISLAAHLLAFGIYQTGTSLHWWQNWQWPAWMQTPRMLAELFQKPLTAQQLAQLQERLQRQQPQVPTIFVEVSPAQATVEAPKKADYYSDKNSLAANPDATVDSNRPKINGTQKEIPKTEDVPRPKPFPLQPVPPAAMQPKPSPPREPTPPLEAAKPKPAYTPGDLALVKPSDVTRKAEDQTKTSAEAEPPAKVEKEPQPHKRPATVAEALAKLEDHTGLVGQKMKQEGGVRRHELDSSLDAQATPFGAYDWAVVRAVERRWYDLLADQRYADDRPGKVSFQFHLNSDGTISQMKLIENTVDLVHALICESAIREPSPYAPWPEEMRRIIGENYREVTFTFYYR